VLGVSVCPGQKVCWVGLSCTTALLSGGRESTHRAFDNGRMLVRLKCSFSHSRAGIPEYEQDLYHLRAPNRRRQKKTEYAEFSCLKRLRRKKKMIVDLRRGLASVS
jgi:hypothetical protein